MRVENSFALVDSEISINNKKVGIVTSSTWSPFQVCGVAIVHMDNAEFGPDTIVVLVVMMVVCKKVKLYFTNV